MKDLTKGNVYKTFFLFALPLMLSGLLSQSYNIIDTAIAGKYLKEAGLAAISCTSSFITLVSSVMWGFCSGVGIYTAILFGAKDYRRIKSLIASSALLLSLTGFLVCAFFVIIKNPIFSFLNVDSSIRTEASRYFTIYTLGLVLVILNNFGLTIMNSLGASGYPFYMSLLSAALNIAGNIISITVLHMGAVGVALSTVLSALVVDVFYFFKIRSCLKELGVLHEKIYFNSDNLKNLLNYATPVTAQQLIMYVSGFLIAPSINALGAAATASFAVSNHVYNVCASLYQNSSKTVSTYSSQCLGAKKSNKLKKGVWVGFVQASATIIPIIFLFSVFAREISLFFFEKGYSGDALGYSVEFVKYFLPFVLLNVINNLFHSFWRGITAMPYLLWGTAIGTVSRIALTLVLTPRLGMTGVHLAWALSWLVEIFPNLALFFSGKWKKFIVKYE